MCWRDDIVTERYCSDCGQEYYGDLGHRGCPTLARKTEDPFSEEITAVATRHGWDVETTKDKIKRTQEILALQSSQEAIDFLLEAIPNTKQDIITKLEEDNPPF